MQRQTKGYLACALAAIGMASAGVAAAGPSRTCPAYPWNVSHEVALFAGAATTVHAGTIAGPAPAIETDRLYAVVLSRQSDVHFALPPGRTRLMAGDSAGILKLRVPAAGVYRISIGKPFWIDVVARGRLVGAKDFHGSHACPGPHKIVEFTLPQGTLLLQLSGYVADSVHLTVTPAPARRVHRPGKG